MSKRMKYKVCLTDVVKGKVKSVKETNNPDVVEKWLADADHPNHDWCYPEDLKKQKVAKEEDS